MNLKLKYKPKPSSDELYVFFLQLEAFYSSGEGMIKAFDTLYNETENERLREFISEAKKSYLKGEQLSKIFARSTIFPSFVSKTLAPGEEVGTLGTAFSDIGKNLEINGEVEREIDSAFLPIKIVGALISVAIAILVTQVYPSFKKLFEEFDIEFPLITQIVMGSINLLLDYWLILLVFMIAGFYIFLRWKKRNPEKWDAFLLKLPLYKAVYYYILQFRFSKTYGLLLKAGIPAIQALEITADAMDSPIYARILHKAANTAKKDGSDVSVALRKHNTNKIVSPVIIGMLATGENSAETPKLLAKLDSLFLRLLKSRIRAFKEKIGPVFLTPIMLVVVSVILSIYLPIFKITSGVK